MVILKEIREIVALDAQTKKKDLLRGPSVSALWACNNPQCEVTNLMVFPNDSPSILGLPSAYTFPYGLRLRIDTATTFPLAGGRGPSIAPIERLGNSVGFPAGWHY